MNSTANLENRLRAIMASPVPIRVKARRGLEILDILMERKNANSRLINNENNMKNASSLIMNNSNSSQFICDGI
jgi:hypothetical protein